MKRRELIEFGGLAAIAWPFIARAQQQEGAPRVGFLFYGSPGPSPEIEAFRKGLADLGYHEDQNIIIQYRFASGRIEQLPELAAELVGLKPAVIVCTNTPSAVALKQATSTIAIVFAGIADAVGSGLVTNFARPGGNITGFTSLSAELSGKRLELLKGVVSNVSRVAVLYNPADRSNVLMFEGFQASAPSLALTLHAVPVKEPGEFDAAFGTMARDRADALFGTAGVLTLAHRRTLVDLAGKMRIPAMWGHRQFVEIGGLTSYAVNFYDQCRRAATYVDQILKGTKPGELPVQQPSTFEFIINLKTANALGLTIPPSILARADEVIE